MERIIDCDVHPHGNGIEDFLPYVQGEAWRKRFSAKEFSLTGRATERYSHPGSGPLRADTVPPGGGLAASDPAWVVKDFLEPYDVEAALLLSIQGAAVAAWTDPVAAAVFSTAANDYFIEKWVEFDPRYKLAITVGPHNPETAADEIRARTDTEGVVAVFLPLLGILMGNRHYYPIYEAAQECGMPVVIHPTGAEGCYIGSPPLAGGVPRSYAERHALLPQVGQANIVSLVFEGVFERFRELKVVLVEFGWSWAVPLLWRMDREWANFRYDTPWLTVPPSEYVRERIRFATQPMDEPDDRGDLLSLLKMMNAEQTLLFSSDYPHYDTDNPSVIISRLPSEMRAAIARENALATFAGRLEIARATA